jgi:hypothetical protein
MSLARRSILTVLSLSLAGAVWAADPPPTRRFQLTAGNAALDVTIESGELALADAAISSWIATSARAVTAYYGKFPVQQVRITVHPGNGRRVGSGVTHGGRRPRIDIDVGRTATREALDRDWVLTHEMTHLAFPNVPDENHWIEEGIASYVEPFARLKIGTLTREKVWGDLVSGLPQGLPEEGDKGLDHTHTWGRTYWGGALFCFLADVQIRKETECRFGLEDALRGIQAAGGSIRDDWELARALEAGDRATGTHVLAKLYDSMKATPVTPDLAKTFKDLGVEVRNRRAVFDDEAPLANVRKSIERARRWF